MSAVYILLALFLGPIDTLQNKQVVHLPPHRTVIDTSYAGKLVELINAPPTLNLPVVPPKHTGEGLPWSVDLKNLGPGTVVVIGKPPFSVSLSPNQTVHIYSNGDGYLLKH